MLKESLANALDDPAMDLALEQERVDGAAEIVDDGEALNYDGAGICRGCTGGCVVWRMRGRPAWKAPAPAPEGPRKPPLSPDGVRSVSPIITSTRSGSTPSWSETSCLYEVTRPVPYSWLPMTSSMRSSLNSIEAVSGKPPPQRSVYVAMPIPRSLSFRSL